MSTERLKRYEVVVKVVSKVVVFVKASNVASVFIQVEPELDFDYEDFEVVRVSLIKDTDDES